jgi:outer membrane receptor protein involved in Fe transport
MKSTSIRRLLLASAVFTFGIGAASAQDFNVPAGDLKLALDAYSAQTGTPLIYPAEAVRGIRTGGAKGPLSAGDALSRILSGTGFGIHREEGAIAIIRQQQSAEPEITPIQMAQAAPARAAVETVTVTSSKLGGADVQSIPIAITALSQEQLTSTQTAGGPDLVKQVPNLTFSKTNFTGYNIQIRGIGTQAISVTTDPAVAVAFNDTPFIRNHFFEQEFYDVAQVEVLRGPQGTLYGRNATAGVVNLTSAKPTDQFEAMASGEFGNYGQKRFEGMINIPIVDDWLDIRLAGEWTKRNGYTFNEYSHDDIDGRDLWSGRLSIGWHPYENLQTNLVWEHFSENDDRLRSGKQLCNTAPQPKTIGGQPVPDEANLLGSFAPYLSQGCQMGSLYSASAYGVPYGYSLPYYAAATFGGFVTGKNPYLNDTQTPDLRVINTQLTPIYKAKNDTVEFNADYQISPSLTFTSETGFNNDFLWSTEDYNRFASTPGMFVPNAYGTLTDANGVFCDPQLGCSDKILAEDLSEEHSWQASQEFRLASHFSGPFNFSAGGNYLHYETAENYYVFINTLTAFANSESVDTNPARTRHIPWVPGVTDDHECLARYGGMVYHDPALGGGQPESNACVYIDPHPIGSLDNQGHNYFLSQNPYTLNSYAAFGETYYDIFKSLKLIAGLRWTEDQKHFVDIPSQLLANGAGYPTAASLGQQWDLLGKKYVTVPGYPASGIVDQQWDAITGRAALNWTPKLDFTDQTLVYSSYAHGYKAGGANPPAPNLPLFGNVNPIHPLTFKPEYVDAFELGTKNTLLDGTLTLNSSAFYYNYQGYQISEIVDRTAINLNFDAHVKGAEIEATWEPLPGLRFNASGGYEDARAANGQKAVDLMDRTAGHSDWMVVRPFATGTSNCILPKDVVAALLYLAANDSLIGGNESGTNPVMACAHAYEQGFDPVTQLPYTADPTTGIDIGGGPGLILAGYKGFDPATAPNGGEGFDKDLSHHVLPNAPPFTFSAGAQYSLPVTQDWAGTLRADFYWQDDSWARIFNDNPYDRLHGYTNLNLTLILTSQNGWQVMGYMKNVLDTTAITGDFLNSDDSNLTTNVFLTDPRLIGVRITKNW